MVVWNGNTERNMKFWIVWMWALCARRTDYFMGSVGYTRTSIFSEFLVKCTLVSISRIDDSSVHPIDCWLYFRSIVVALLLDMM